MKHVKYNFCESEKSANEFRTKLMAVLYEMRESNKEEEKEEVEFEKVSK